MPNPRTHIKTIADVLIRPIRANGAKRRFYDSEVRGLALRMAPGGELAFTLNDRIIGKPPAMSLEDARRIARGAGANAATPIRYLEVCAGIGSASLAFESLRWRCVGMAEIDRKARAFLSQRFPETKLHGDFRKITPAKVGRVDVLVGGPPCQSWSKIRRDGDEDPRGELGLDFLDLARAIDAPWFVFENVFGLFQSERGRDFWRRWLKRADECGYHVAWRVLDTRQFGLPARRKRLFAVGHIGGPEPAYRTLFDPRRASFPYPTQAIAEQLQARSGRREPKVETARAIALNQRFNEFTEYLPTLRTSSPGFAAVLMDERELRRFTITELERCMGFPDNWTAFEWEGAPASYRLRAGLLGNAFCPSILNWIGQGIETTAAPVRTR